MIIQRKWLLVAAVLLLALVILCAAVRPPLAETDADVSGETVAVPIIMYHAVMQDKSRSGKYVITPETLKADIAYILEAGCTPVFISELKYYVNNTGELPDKPIVLSFDDGYYNNYLYAFPLLKEFGVKAELSVIVRQSELAESAEHQSASYSHCTFAQLREMKESGLVAIENHTYDMHTNTIRSGVLKKKGESDSAYRTFITNDITHAQELLEQNVGVLPSVFTYPFGSFCRTSEEVLDELGFVCSLSCEEGINYIGRGGSLRLLKRYNRPSGKSSAEFFSKIFGQIKY